VNSLPLRYTQRALASIGQCPAEIRPAVLELLSRITANYISCSQITTFPRPVGLWESGLWCRHPDGRIWFVEILFKVGGVPEHILIRNAVITEQTRLPGWVVSPSEWTVHDPWPVVDV
jgi:hypothetical protein